MRDVRLMAAAMAVIVIVLAGEAYIYCNDWDEMYRSELSQDSHSVEISSGSSNRYDVVTIGGSPEKAETTAIYYDPSYGEHLDETHHATGGTYLDQEYYVTMLADQLETRGAKARILDAGSLADMMRESMSSGRCSQAVVIASGAIPDTIYSGSESDIVIQWLNAGGRLYWIGGIIGQFISHADGQVSDIGTGMQGLFLGSATQNEAETFGTEPISEEWSESLSLMGNGTLYGVDASNCRDSLQMGFTDGTYSSIGLVGKGEGFVCVFGGVLSNDQRADVAQVLASGIGPDSHILDHRSGSVTRETVSVPLESASPSDSVYVYLGGYFAVYGKSFRISGR